MTVQSTPRKDGFKQAAVARRLNACAAQPAPHVFVETVHDESIKSQVHHCKAEGNFVKGKVNIMKGQQFYLAPSAHFLHRFFFVIVDNAVFRCSCGNPRCGHITDVKQHIANVAARRSARKAS